MGEVTARAGVSQVTVSAIVRRADGAVEDPVVLRNNHRRIIYRLPFLPMRGDGCLVLRSGVQTCGVGILLELLRQRVEVGSYLEHDSSGL